MFHTKYAAFPSSSTSPPFSSLPAVDIHKPVDLTVLNERVRAGNNAATVLKTELPMFKATPVSYLMYGPFGSFAPVYDSTFATLTKMDSDLLLSTYGSDLGVSYSHRYERLPHPQTVHNVILGMACVEMRAFVVFPTEHVVYMIMVVNAAAFKK